MNRMAYLQGPINGSHEKVLVEFPDWPDLDETVLLLSKGFNATVGFIYLLLPRINRIHWIHWQFHLQPGI